MPLLSVEKDEYFAVRLEEKPTIMSFLQEFAVELDGWANEPRQSSVRQIFQTTTGKCLQNYNNSQKLKEKLSNKPQRQIFQKLQARQLFEVIDYILVHRSNVDCEWRIEGPTGHFLSFNFQQVLHTYC